MGLKRGAKAQVWSIDLVIGVLIFALISVSIYAFLKTGGNDNKIKRYSEEAQSLTEKLIDMGLINRDTGEFNETVYQELTQMNYGDLRMNLVLEVIFVYSLKLMKLLQN